MTDDFAKKMRALAKRKDTSRLPVLDQLEAERKQGGEYSKEEYALDHDASVAARQARTQIEADAGDNVSIAAIERLRKKVAALRASRDKGDKSR